MPRGLTKVGPYGASSKTPAFIIEKGPGWGPFAVSNRVALLALSEDRGGDPRYAAARVVGDVGGVEAETAAGLVRVAGGDEAGAFSGLAVFGGAL